MFQEYILPIDEFTQEQCPITDMQLQKGRILISNIWQQSQNEETISMNDDMLSEEENEINSRICNTLINQPQSQLPYQEQQNVMMQDTLDKRYEKLPNMFNEVKLDHIIWDKINKNLTHLNSEGQPFLNKLMEQPQPQPQIPPQSTITTTSKKPNYEKNICSYVAKKVFQCFLSKNQIKRVKKLCKLAECSYDEAIEYYSKQYRQVFSLNHLSKLITPQNENEKPLKEMFCAFFNWFLRQRYMLYVLQNGKMTEKQKYIDFKNKYILNIAQISEKYSYMF